MLAGSVVQRDNGQQESIRTDRDGRYRFRSVSGTVTVTAMAEPSYVAETVEVTMEADRTVDFTLQHTGIPPYGGTVFITPDVVGPSDPTSLRGVTYTGRGQRVIYDRRPDAWITVNAYLFRVRYGGAELEFQVNPEFGNREAARAEVDTYAAALGRLPAVLLSRAQKVQINAGDELFGGNWRDQSFLIHTDQGREYIRNGFLEEVFIHESAHVSLDGAHDNSAGWRAAQDADGVFISEYARDYPDREDVAESILPYFAVRYRPERLTDPDRSAILTAIPNRLLYFDEAGTRHVALQCDGVACPTSWIEFISAAADLATVRGAAHSVAVVRRWLPYGLEVAEHNCRSPGSATAEGRGLCLLFIHPRDGDHGYTQPERAPGGRAVSGWTLQPLRATQIYDRRRQARHSQHRGACLDMKEGPGKRDILSRPASKKAAARLRSAPRNEPKPVPVPLPEGVRHQRVGETTERSAHLEKLKQLFEAAPISRYLGMTLSSCENGVAHVRLPFRGRVRRKSWRHPRRSHRSAGGHGG